MPAPTTNSPTTSSRAPNAPPAARRARRVLIAAPVLAWSRYRIPATNIPPAVLANPVHLQAHVLAGWREAVGGRLPSAPTSCRRYCATAEFAKVICGAAADNLDLQYRHRGHAGNRAVLPTPATCLLRW